MGSKWMKRVKETKLVQVELELVEASLNTSKCVKLKIKADKYIVVFNCVLYDVSRRMANKLLFY